MTQRPVRPVRPIRRAPPPRRRGRRLASLLLSLAVGGLLAAGATALILYRVLSHNLPDLQSIDDYLRAEHRPNLVTGVYDRHGELIGEFFWENQRRYLIEIEALPAHVVQAFVAAEDKDFYKHEGIDLWGIVRAAVANLRAGEIKQGASTITQQVVKSLLLSTEKTYSRKMREAILAKRIEDRFTKEEILYLYLNQIYFGSGAYGVEAAAREFFGKNAADLTLAEAALLAGLVQAPGAYHPRQHRQACLHRRHYVLRRMMEDGYLELAAFNLADGEEPQIRKQTDLNAEKAPEFVEYVRRYLIGKYGAERVLKSGWRVDTTCDLSLQRAAYRAALKGLREHARRQGLLDLPPAVPADNRLAWRNTLAARNADRAAGEPREGFVVGIDDVAGNVTVDEGDEVVKIKTDRMKWVRQVRRNGRNAEVRTAKPGKIFRLGDRVLVGSGSPDKAAGPPLEPWPAAEAALVALEVNTRHVLAMVGGQNFSASEFNRAVQAHRQPGSSFKPIVYAAALNAGLTPATIFPDTALVYADNWRPANYDRKFRGYMTLRQALTKSVNTVTIRVADMIGVDYLVRFARHLGLRSLINQPGDLSMAIGTYEVTPLELTNAYTVFAAGGLLADPVFVTQVTDYDGTVLERAEKNEVPEQAPALENVPRLRHLGAEQWPAETAELTLDPLSERRRYEFLTAFNIREKPELAPTREEPATEEPTGDGRNVWRQVLDPRVAYLITSMMHSVATEGTGAKSNILKKIVAGKTGTTNQYVDAWFVGFSPEIVAGVWVGYDQGARSLGRGESGSTTALPVWIDFMQTALAERPNLDFPAPPGIVYAEIDPETGLLAPPGLKGVREIFLPGTEPTEYAPSPTAPRPQDFFDIEEL